MSGFRPVIRALGAKEMETLDCIKESHDALLQSAEKLVFDKQHPWHRNLVALHGSIIELSSCLITLIENRCATGVPSVFRTLLETYVEFHNLANDKKYGYHMEASYLDQWLKVLKEAVKGNNPYLESIGKSPDIHENILEHEKELKNLKEKGYNPLSIYSSFEKAEMQDIYRSIYNFVSNDAHSNIRALIKRHFEITENDLTVVYYREEPPENFVSEVDTSTSLLIQSGIKLHNILESEALDEVEALNAKLEAWRKQHLTNSSSGTDNP